MSARGRVRGLGYRERIRAPAWLRAVLYGAAAVSAAGAVIVLFAPDTPDAVRWSTFAALAVGFALLLAAARWMLVLDVQVGRDVFAFGFGPFGRRLRPRDIESVEVVPYRAVAYGGWGLRWRLGGRRAYTVPFRWSGVEVQTRDGHRYFVSSERPEALRDAVRALMGR